MPSPPTAYQNVNQHGKGVSSAPLHMVTVDLIDPDAPATLTELCGLPGGIMATPPVVDTDRKVVAGYDSSNAAMTAWHYGDATHTQDQACTFDPISLVAMTDLHPAASSIEREHIDSCAVDLDTQRRFLREGFVRLDGLWTDEFATALSRDALAAWPAAQLPTVGPRTPVTRERTELRPTPVATGPLLEALHAALTRLARTLSGRMLVPSFAAYGYFEHDDECILHFDTGASEVTLLIMALGEVAPLRVHPELRAAGPDDLGALEDDPAWDRLSGIPLAYPRTGLTAILGQELPHHRPPGTVANLSAVSALHYRSAF